MKRIIISTTVGAVALAVLVFGGQQLSTRLFGNASPAAFAQSSIPSHVLYDSLFRMDISFRRRALEQELTGQPVTSMKTYFKDEVALTDAEDKILEQTAIDFLKEVEPIDNEAKQILKQFRELYADGEVPDGQQVPAPPAELGTLQQRRNAAALNNREKLRNGLGENRFGEFDGFVQQEFSTNFQSNGASPRE